ncbi:MAG: S9 family peptidase [Terracidiphilus sp.]
MVFAVSRTFLRATLAASAALAFGLWLAPAHAQTVPVKSRIDEILRSPRTGRGFQQVAVSPDGARLAWVERAQGGEEIRVAPLDSPQKSERVTAAAKPEIHCDEGQIAWRPDSKALAFFSDCAKEGQADLYLSGLDAKPARRIAALKGYEESPAFSPDGSRIAFLYVEGATRPASALAAIKPWSGVIGEEGVEVQRIAVARLDQPAAAVPEMATPAALHVYEFDWRPDSKGFAYVAANPPGDNNWWVAKLYTQGLGGEPKAILAPATVDGPLHGLQIAVPRWSPDAKTIAFIGGLMSDQGSTGGDVWIVSAEGGAPRDLTQGRPTTSSWLEWSTNEYLFASELAGGNCQLIRYKLGGDRVTPGGAVTFGSPIFSIPGTVGDGRMELSLSASADHGLFVFQASTFEHAPEIYGARPGTVMTSGLDGVLQLTHVNDGLKPAWGQTVAASWRSDKFRVQGWLTLPRDYDPKNKYPMVVEVHGGPAAAATGRWGGGYSLGITVFSNLGYFVFQPNPRGSFGQGEEFVQANRKDFGYGDLRDILSGVDAVLARYPVDPNRIGILGWSYGGFMSMFAVTQTNRFRAAVAGAGISNWQSYYGENSIDQWMIPYFGASVYEDPAVYARSSAINFIRQAKTPTLVVVGDRDGECPPPQSFEFWHALRAQQVPTQLVVYPNEGHGFTQPEHRRDVLERAAEWFARYMPATQ